MGGEVLSFPPFSREVAEERLTRGGLALKLRRKPFAILKYLARNPNRLVTHQELTEAIWGKVSMSENVLRTHVYVSFAYAPLLFSNLSSAEWLLGRPDAALGAAGQSVAHATQARDPFVSALALAAAAAVHTWRREWPEALELARRGAHMVAEAGSSLGSVWNACVLQRAAVELGEATAEARAESSRSLELRAAMSLYRFTSGEAKRRWQAVVREVYASFNEGHTTGDLVDAKSIIDAV